MRPLKILVVEDEALVSMLLTKYLAAVGYEICACVSTGEEAVQVAKKQHPDVIIMDRRLAGKMDGLEASRQIRQFSKQPIVFVTGYIDESVHHEIPKLSPAVYLIKPVPVTEVKAAIENLMKTTS